LNQLAAPHSTGVDRAAVPRAAASAIAAATTSPWLGRSGAPRAPRFRASASPQRADAHRLSRSISTASLPRLRVRRAAVRHGRPPWSRLCLLRYSCCCAMLWRRCGEGRGSC
jgi:hypothetical protein